MKRIILLILTATALFLQNWAANKAYIVPVSVTNFDAQLYDIEAGDTLYIEGGVRRYLRISNLKGDSLNYILITNYGGEAIVENDNWHYGLVLSNCKYFRLTGSADNSKKFGIQILKTGKGASGLSIGELSSNYEVDHIEIANTGFAGIFAFSQPTCDLSANRGNFVQRNAIIRDNYIHDTYGEGMYLGHSFFTGYTIVCNNVNQKVFPHEIIGLKVYNNLIINAGYDGIQVCSAIDSTEVYNNTILNYGTKMEEAQHSGIQIGAGTKLRCYNNRIINGSGTGIFMLGMGGSYIYNNFILNAGLNFFPDSIALRIHGIFVDDRYMLSGTSHYILNNTIISPKSDGILFISKESVDNLIANNLIVNPGSIYRYQPENSKFINVAAKSSVILQNNYYTNFMDKSLNPDSIKTYVDLYGNLPIVSAGADLSMYGIFDDMMGNLRAVQPSIGAFEYSNKKNLPQQIEAREINFIQNTATGVVILVNKTERSIKSLSVYNSVGRKVISEVINDPSYYMCNLKSKLKTGVYLIAVEKDTVVFSNKFIVN